MHLLRDTCLRNYRRFTFRRSTQSVADLEQHETDKQHAVYDAAAMVLPISPVSGTRLNKLARTAGTPLVSFHNQTAPNGMVGDRPDERNIRKNIQHEPEYQPLRNIRESRQVGVGIRESNHVNVVTVIYTSCYRPGRRRMRRWNSRFPQSPPRERQRGPCSLLPRASRSSQTRPCLTTHTGLARPCMHLLYVISHGRTLRRDLTQ